MRKPWQMSGIVITFSILCIVASTAFGFNNYALRNASQNVIALNYQIEFISPYASNPGDTLYRGKQTRANVEANRAFDKLLISEPAEDSHRRLYATSSIAGFSNSVHKSNLHQLYQLTDIPPPSYLAL